MHARQAKSPNWSREFLDKFLVALTVNPAAALLDTPLVGLIGDPAAAPTVDSDKADFDSWKATFTDYAKKALVLVHPWAVGPNYRASGDFVDWSITTDPIVTGNRIYGYWVEDDNGVVLYEMFSVEDQIDMTEVGSSLALEVVLPLPYNVPFAAE